MSASGRRKTPSPAPAAHLELGEHDAEASCRRAVARRTASPSRASNSWRSKSPVSGSRTERSASRRSRRWLSDTSRTVTRYRGRPSSTETTRPATSTRTRPPFRCRNVSSPTCSPRAIELGVPGVELVPVLGRPEREGRLGAEERVPVEPELVAETAVDRADASVLRRRGARRGGPRGAPGRCPSRRRASLVDRAPGDPAEEEDERRGERQRERRGGREPEHRARWARPATTPSAATAAAAAATSSEQEILDAAPPQWLMPSSPVRCARTCASPGRRAR